ncbi:MAG: hypothetical protein KC420_22425, partial [Myxococcales bacterium]|nr:hypothetical protein [Myxococcales bacterium]
AVAEACGVGQLEFLGSGPLVVPERERRTLEDLGEDIVDDEDTLDGLEEADAEGEPDVEEDAEPTADEQEHTVDEADLASAAE